MDLFYDSLMGFCESTGGQIRYDNHLLEDLDIGHIRNHIQLIAYDQFFAGTVLENLTGLGASRNYTATEIQDVLMRVGLYENIEALPKKLLTEIKPNGFPFSKSQLLAIQIARALIMQPKILLITPDYEQISTYKRKLIFNELLNKKNQWTLLFFTQRYYGPDFDRYCVFERSKMKNLPGSAEVLKEIENYG